MKSGIIVSDRLADAKPSPEVECMKSELHGHLLQFVSELSPSLRKVIQLRHLEEYDDERSSAHSGCGGRDSEIPGFTGAHETEAANARSVKKERITQMTYVANTTAVRRELQFRRSGRSGIVLPPISLGLWQNFGGVNVFETGRAVIRRAFDRGVTHFDLANNYGPPYGSAEENFGEILRKDFRSHRNELLISTKAGWDMWPGPYGVGGSRKYMLASLDESLARMGLEYVDIFYSHRPTVDVPLEETMGALAQAVRQGKALYVGISSYSPERTREAAADSEERRSPAADSSAVLLDAESMGGKRTPRHAGGTRRRLHCVLRAGAGAVDEQVSEWGPRKLAREGRRLVSEGVLERRQS